MFYFNTVADAGLTQVFPVSTGKIQFFSRSRAVAWHQPFWMTQSTKGECIPMAPLCTSIPTLHLTFLLPYFPFASASTQSWWQGHYRAWGTRNMAISQLHLWHPHLAEELALCKTPLCPEAQVAQYFHVGNMGQLELCLQAPHMGQAPSQAPSDPGPGWKTWFTHSWMSLLVVSLAGLEADASVTAGLRKLSLL